MGDMNKHREQALRVNTTSGLIVWIATGTAIRVICHEMCLMCNACSRCILMFSGTACIRCFKAHLACPRLACGRSRCRVCCVLARAAALFNPRRSISRWKVQVGAASYVPPLREHSAATDLRGRRKHAARQRPQQGNIPLCSSVCSPRRPRSRCSRATTCMRAAQTCCACRTPCTATSTSRTRATRAATSRCRWGRRPSATTSASPSVLHFFVPLLH
jgi:hypothetical protein